MKTIQVLTTDQNGGASACEALWYEMAENALGNDVRVEAHISALSQGNLTVKTLTNAGAKFICRGKPITGGRAQMLLQKCRMQTTAKFWQCRAMNPDADFLLLNVGTLLEVSLQPWASVLRKSKCPYGILVHNNPEIRQYSSAQRAQLRELLTCAKRVYFVSERLWRNAEELLLSKIPGAQVVRNPVNLSSDELEPWPEVVGDEIRFAVVGRLDAFIKGQIRIMHALSSAKWKARNWKLSFYGAGPDEALIREAISFYGLEQFVNIEGFVTDIRKEIWAQNHVLLMPSMLEGMPLTLVEAMVCGRPALCSDVGGASELVMDGENGFLAGAPFASQLANALERVWQKRDQLQDMGQAAHQSGVAFLPENPGCDLLEDILSVISK